MKTENLLLWALFSTLLFATTPAHAGAWTQKTGAAQLISGVGIYKAADVFAVNGDRRTQTPFYKEEFSNYLEYGLRDDVTLGGQLALARTHQSSTTSPSSNWNLGDATVFIRKRLWQNETLITSLQPFLLLPSPDQKTDTPKIGSDNYSVGLKANVGHNFKLFERWHYADLAAGYAYRAGRSNDQLTLDATVGLNVTQEWQIVPQLFLTRSRNTIQAAGAGFTQSSADDYNASKLQLSVQYQLSPKVALQAGVFDTIEGKNTGAGKGALLNYIRNF